MPGASREPVLKQIRLPHAYYYREMYVPQVTSGPTSATWSPDGQELIYSMQGSLWRQRIGSIEASQLTSGDGYDYQPDWSPDGRHVVYATYRSDAVELWLLDLTRGATRAIVAQGAVNVDPRWSPDGSRLAFVSTSHEGRWHVFVAPIDDGQIGAPVRVTEDHDSRLPRYYYSVWDHYLSPSWSPDGRELMLVSNRGRVWGTGGLWRMAAVPGTPAREIHYEETTWKARPDWSPDGKRVVYSSYLGRQWHQLWLVPASGGDAFQLTYGDFDATAPRWSPDGSRIAFISNEDGNTSLWVLTVPGGSRARVEAGKRLYRTPVGSSSIATCAMATAPRCRHASRCTTPRARATRRTMRGVTPTRPSSGASGASSTAIFTRTARARSRCRRANTSSRRRAGRSTPSHAARCASSLTAPPNRPSSSIASPTCRRAAGGAAICTST